MVDLKGNRCLDKGDRQGVDDFEIVDKLATV